MEPAILYVDDERANLDLFQRSFDEELCVLTAPDGKAALELLCERDIGVLVSDQRMAPMTGIELLTEAAARWPSITRMLLTAYSDRELLLQAIHKGKVDDYVLKPWRREDLAVRLHAGLDLFCRRRAQAQAETERDLLRDQLASLQPAELVGLNAGLSELAARLAKIAPTDSSVLIRGETGTGKELVARELHRRSQRCDRPFVRVNVAAFGHGVLESELFGHEKDSFTDARKQRIGRFEQADGGTIFLDEIGDVSMDTQVRLLRVLQEREFERVGGTSTVKVDIRVLTATHRDLEAMVQAGQFRADLFYRLNVVPLLVPPLRTRCNDIEMLARHFLARFSLQFGKRLELSAAAVASLRQYDWPGNVRELRNLIENAAVLADDVMTLEPGDLTWTPCASAAPAPSAVQTPAQGTSVFAQIAQAEAEQIRNALFACGGSIARSAKHLGIPRTTLTDRIRKLGIT